MTINVFGVVGLPLTGGTLTGDLLFTDALYDIGKAGATRPRNIIASGFMAANGGFGNNGLSGLSQGMAFSGSTTAIAGGGSGAIVRLSDNSGNVYLEGITGRVTLGGATAVAAPGAKILDTQNVIAGTTNTAGALWTLDGSVSTGGGLGGAIRARHSDSVAAATAQNALAETWRSDFVGFKVASGKQLWLGNAYVAGVVVTTGTVILYDSAGVAVRVLVANP